MMSHIPAELLSGFVDGSVDERSAVQIAEHIDGCPSCAARAANLEPLSRVFAATPERTPPPDLVPKILRRLEHPDWLLGREVVVGLSLLVVAALLALMLDSPLALAADALLLVKVTGTVARGLATAITGDGAIGAFQVALSFAATAALGGAFITLHFGAPAESLRSGRAR